MSGIDITSLFGDIIPPMARPEPEAVDISQAGSVAGARGATLGNRLQESVGGMFGIDYRTDAETIRDQLQSMGTPSTPAEHKAYADLLDQLQSGAGVQYMMKVQQEKRASDEAESQISRRNAITANELREADRLDADAKAPTILNTSTGAVVSYDPVAGTVTSLFNGSNDDEATEAGIRRLNGLVFAAEHRYPEGSAERTLIQEQIAAGNITEIEDFDKFVPKAPPVQPIPVAVQKIINSNLTQKTEVMTTIGRSSNLINTILDNGLLDDSWRTRGGIFTKASEYLATELGMRDTLSISRTGATREVNTNIVNNLPKGTASDADVRIFSAGFPDVDSASMEELYQYLQAARNVSNLALDQTRLKEGVWLKQQHNNLPVSMLGISTAEDDMDFARKELRAENDALLKAVEEGGLDREEYDFRMGYHFQDFKDDWGFVPAEFE